MELVKRLNWQLLINRTLTTDVPPLHDETYDFPDTLIPEGTAMFLELIRSATLQNSA